MFERFEHRSAPLLPRAAFVGRFFRSLALASALICGSLALGIAGYRLFGRLSWIDSLLNASMILTGMGPVDPMPSDGAKLFASFYALFSGVAFLTIVAILLAPMVHRFIHRFHLELADDSADDPGSRTRGAPDEKG